RAQQQIRSWEPDWPAPVRVSAFDLDVRFRRLVANFFFAEAKRVLLMVLGKTPDSIVGEKFVAVPNALEKTLELVLFENRQDMLLGVAAGISVAADSQVGPFADEPFHARQELGMIIEVVIVEHFDGKHRNQTDQRSHPKFVKFTVGIAQNIVEETFAFIPKRVLAAPHVLHGAAYIDE